MLAGMIPLTNDNEQSTDGEMPDLVHSEPEAYHFPLKRKTRPRTRRLTKLDFNEIGYRMHEAMLLDNRENVLKAARMNGWVSHRPTQNGLVPLAGDGRRDFLLGSSRLLQETVFLKGPACHATSAPNPPPLLPLDVMSRGVLCAKKIPSSLWGPAPPGKYPPSRLQKTC